MSAEDELPLMSEDFETYARMILARSAPEIEFPRLRKGILYPPGVLAIDAYLRSRYQNGNLQLPDFDLPNETVAVFSDYGGNHSASAFKSYSFLFMAYNYRDVLGDALTRLREQYGLRQPATEIGFKKLNYGPVQRILPDYLKAIDALIAGWLVTIIVNKSISTLTGIGGPGGSRYVCDVLEKGGYGGWKPKIAEEILRITHFVSYLCALAIPDGAKIFWMTDNDSIVPNCLQARRAMNVFCSLLPEYTNKRFPAVGYATPFPERHNMLHHDLLSAADLAAGAFSEYCSSLRDARQPAERARSVYVWLARRASGLRKTTMVIEPADDGHLKITGLEGGKLA